MKKLLFILFLLTSSSVFADTSFGFVDLDSVLKNTQEGQVINKNYTLSIFNLEMTLIGKRMKIQEMEKKLALMNESVEKDKYDKLIDATLNEYDAYESKKYKSINDNKAFEQSDLLKRINPVIISLAKSKNIDIVSTSKDEIIYQKNIIDLTQESINLYDIKYPVKDLK